MPDRHARRCSSNPPDRPREIVATGTSDVVGGVPCPLEPSWRRWDMFGHHRFFDLTPELERRVARARRQKPPEGARVVDATWRVARDDAGIAPPTEEATGRPPWKYLAGCPCHIHADILVDGHSVHIDLCAATMFGPGRSWREVWIFVDGSLAGRAHRCGSSIGVGGDTFPAVALVGSGALLTVDADIERVVQIEAAGARYLRNDASVQRPVVRVASRSRKPHAEAGGRRQLGLENRDSRENGDA